jgi:hypothetical protein
VWVPRLLCTLKVRAWLTTYAAALVFPSEVWPEIFLMLVQFGGLVLVVWSVGLPTSSTEKLYFTTPVARQVGGFSTPGEVLVTQWVSRRENFLTPRGATLAEVVHLVLGATPVAAGGKTWFTLREKLRPALLMSETPGVNHLG